MSSKKGHSRDGCTMRTAEKAAQRLSRAVDEAFPSDSEQDRRRRHGCQPKYHRPTLASLRLVDQSVDYITGRTRPKLARYPTPEQTVQ